MKKRYQYALTDIVRRFNETGELREVKLTEEGGSIAQSVPARFRELACGHVQRQMSGGKAEQAEQARCFTCYPRT